MDDLVAFLAARLDEDETAAKAASGPGWWLGITEDEDKRSIRYTGPSTLHGGLEADYYVADRVDLADAVHIARHDPARVLAEVEAKQAILAEHTTTRGEPPLCPACDMLPGPCRTLRLLATIYSTHPGYNLEWKPQP